MANFNVADAKRSASIIIRDPKGDVASVITPKDFQVGFEGSPGSLILKGALDISALVKNVTNINETKIKVSNDTIAYFIKNTSNLDVTVYLPTPPGNLGQMHIVKDYQGTAGTNPILITTTDGSTIDSQSDMSIAIEYGAIMFVWMGNAWVSLALGASGAGAGAASNLKYMTWDDETSLNNSRKLQTTSGHITLSTASVGVVDLSLPNVVAAGSHSYPSVLVVDAQGRVTTIVDGNYPADVSASYIVIGTTSSLPNERKLTAGTGMILVDGGVNGDATLSINDRFVATITGSAFSGPALFNAGITGSLQTIGTGQSYLVAGDNITITSQSNGQILVSSTGGSGGGGADVSASYIVIGTTSSLPNERKLTAGTGIVLTDGGANGDATLSINDRFVATLTGSVFSGPALFNAGITGSLQTIGTGQSYLVAGLNILISSQSNGQIVITSTGGGGDGSSGVDDADFVNGGNKIRTTSSVAFTSQASYAENYGQDVYFYVSGTYGIVGDQARRALFAGDLILSGGLSGSLQQLSTGESYLVAGDNVTITSQSNGQVVISSTGGGSGGGSGQNSITIVAGNQAVNKTVFQSIGCFEFNPDGSETMAPSGSLTYTAFFQPIVEVSIPGITLETILYNIYTNSYITDSLLSSSIQLPTRLKSVDLSGSLQSGSNIYEMHMRVTTPTNTGIAICKGAKLLVTWQ